jgi:uncharacterized protein RhaS with RHS repeats
VEPGVDPTTGLIYLRARWYDPQTGQFLSIDPLQALTQHAYEYANDSPLNGTDPTGLISASDVGNALAGVAAGATGGLSTDVLGAVGINPDRCSSYYQDAQPLGLAAAFLIPGVGEEAVAAEAAGGSDRALATVTALTNEQDTALSAVMSDSNRLDHIFGQAGKHNLGQLTNDLGSQWAVVREGILRVRGTRRKACSSFPPRSAPIQ